MVKNSLIQKIYICLILVSIFIFAGFHTYTTDSQSYLVNYLARWDPTLFLNDITAQSAAHSVTPQFLTDLLLLLLTKAAGSLELAMATAYILSVITLCSAIVSFAFRLQNSDKLLFSCFFVLCILFLLTGQNISLNWTWRTGFYHQVPAMAVGLWCFYLATSKQKNWVFAFALNGLSLLFQMHVGIYIFCFSFILLIFEIYETHKFKLLLCCWPFLLMFLALFAAVTITTSSTIANDDYVQLYSVFRHRNFYVLSGTGSIANILFFLVYFHGVILLGISLLLKYNEDQTIQPLMVKSGSLLLVSFLGLLFNYVFIELVPWAVAAKLQPTRIISVMRVWLILVLCYLFHLLCIRKLTFFVVFLITGVLFASESFWGFWLNIGAYALLLSWYISDRHPTHVAVANRWINITLCISSLILTVYRFPKMDTSRKYLALYISLIIAASFVIYVFKTKSKLLFATCMALCICLTVFTIDRYSIKRDDGSFVRMRTFNEAFPYIRTDKDLYNIALQFKENTDKNVAFFADPLDQNYPYFRLYSQRSQLISSKCIPINDPAIEVWIDRLLEFGSVTKSGASYNYNSEAYQEKNPLDIIKYALKYDAQYLLTTTEDASRYLDSKLVDIYLENDSYIILEIMHN